MATVASPPCRPLPPERTHGTMRDGPANVLNKLPKSVQPKATQALHAIWMAETRAAARRAFAQSGGTFAAERRKQAGQRVPRGATPTTGNAPCSRGSDLDWRYLFGAGGAKPSLRCIPRRRAGRTIHLRLTSRPPTHFLVQPTTFQCCDIPRGPHARPPRWPARSASSDTPAAAGLAPRQATAGCPLR